MPSSKCSWDSPCDPLKDITEATEMVKRDTGLVSDNEESIPRHFATGRPLCPKCGDSIGVHGGCRCTPAWKPTDPLKDITEATEMVKRNTGILSDYPGVSADYDGSGWNTYRAEGERRLNTLLEFAEKNQLTFRFRRHGSGQHWMIECQGPDPLDGVVEHVFDEKDDLSWPLQKCIDVLEVAQHDATLKNTPRPPSSG